MRRRTSPPMRTASVLRLALHLPDGGLRLPARLAEMLRAAFAKTTKATLVRLLTEIAVAEFPESPRDVLGARIRRGCDACVRRPARAAEAVADGWRTGRSSVVVSVVNRLDRLHIPTMEALAESMRAATPPDAAVASVTADFFYERLDVAFRRENGLEALDRRGRRCVSPAALLTHQLCESGQLPFQMACPVCQSTSGRRVRCGCRLEQFCSDECALTDLTHDCAGARRTAAEAAAAIPEIGLLTLTHTPLVVPVFAGYGIATFAPFWAAGVTLEQYAHAFRVKPLVIDELVARSGEVGSESVTG